MNFKAGDKVYIVSSESSIYATFPQSALGCVGDCKPYTIICAGRYISLVEIAGYFPSTSLSLTPPEKPFFCKGSVVLFNDLPHLVVSNEDDSIVLEEASSTKRFTVDADRVIRTTNDELPSVYQKLNKLPLRRILTYLLKLNGGQSSICSYGQRTEKGLVMPQLNDACHARIGTVPDDGDKTKELCLIVGGYRQLFERKEDKTSWKKYKEYLRYLLNDSPWAETFLTKSVESAIRYGIDMNIDMTTSQLAGGAVATREGYEFSCRLEAFSFIKGKGFSGDAAYLCGMLYRRDYGGKSWTEGSAAGGHQALNDHLRWAQLKQFFQKGFAKLPNQVAYKDRTYSNYIINNASVEGYEHGGVISTLRTVARNAIGVKEGRFGDVGNISDDKLIQLAQFFDKELKG